MEIHSLEASFTFGSYGNPKPKPASALVLLWNSIANAPKLWKNRALRPCLRAFPLLVGTALPAFIADFVATATKADNAIIDAPYEPDYAKGLPERREWQRLKKAFLKKRLPLILRKYRDRLRCPTCIDAYMDVAFSVNLAGGVTIHKIEAQRACGHDFPDGMQQEFLQYLKEYPYPKILLGKTVRLRLGSALQC